MKKYAPFLVLVLVILIGFLGYKILGRSGESGLPIEQRPFTSLTPTSDGHWLIMKIGRINVPDAATLEYELLYQVPDRPDQGIPGTVKLDGKDIERKLLLGTESSGKYRFDEGVEHGTLTLKFRNSGNKLIGTISTDFHMQFATQVFSSQDGKFNYTIDEKLRGGYFVTMNTLGLPAPANFSPKVVYGVFSSDKLKFPGQVTLDGTVYYWNGESWTNLGDKMAPDIGVFASTQ